MEDDQQQFVHAQLPVHSQYDRDRLEYELVVRQEPKQARMCGVGADRRPIDPPPIVQLRVLDPSQRSQGGDSRPNSPDGAAAMAASQSFLQNPYYFMFASLAKPDEDVELHWLKDGKTRCTTGSVVSSLYHLKDAEAGGTDAGFFVFPDLSVRTEGSYRLKLSLFEVVGNCVDHCKSIFSAPFYVYTAKKFPGMEESTALSCSLADQGIKIRIRKDIRVRRRPAPGGEAPIPIPIAGPPPPGGAFGPVPVRLDDPMTDEEQGPDERERRLSSSSSIPSVPVPEREPPRRPDSDRESDREETQRRIPVRRDSAPNTASRRGSASDRGSKRRRGDSSTLSIGTSVSGGMVDGPDVTPISAGPSSAGTGWGAIDPALSAPSTTTQQSPATPTSSSAEHHYAPATVHQSPPAGYEHRYSAPPAQAGIPAPAPTSAPSYSYEPHQAPPTGHHYSAPAAPHSYAHVPPQTQQHHASAYPYPPPAPAGQTWAYDPYAHSQPYNMPPPGPAPAHHAQTHPPPPPRYPDYPPYAQQQGYGGYYDSPQHQHQQPHHVPPPTSHPAQHSYHHPGYGPAPAPPSPNSSQAPAPVSDYYQSGAPAGRTDNRSSSHVPAASTAGTGYAQTAYAPAPPPTAPGPNPGIHHHYGAPAPVYSQYAHGPGQAHAQQQSSASGSQGSGQAGASSSGRGHYQLSTPPHHHQTQPYSAYPPAPVAGTSASASASVATTAPAETAWAYPAAAPGPGVSASAWGVMQDGPYAASYGNAGAPGRDVHGHGPRLAPLRVGGGGTPPPGSEGGRGGSSKKNNPLSIGNIISGDTG